MMDASYAKLGRSIGREAEYNAVKNKFESMMDLLRGVPDDLGDNVSLAIENTHERNTDRFMYFSPRTFSRLF